MDFIHEGFEELIQRHIPEDAAINRSEIIEKRGSVVLQIYFTVSDEFAEENELLYKNRIMEILLKRGKEDKSLPIQSWANSGEPEQ